MKHAAEHDSEQFPLKITNMAFPILNPLVHKQQVVHKTNENKSKSLPKHSKWKAYCKKFNE